jgi:hypothetical protein
MYLSMMELKTRGYEEEKEEKKTGLMKMDRVED